jgi:hypothetical protein
VDWILFFQISNAQRRPNSLRSDGAGENGNRRAQLIKQAGDALLRASVTPRLMNRVSFALCGTLIADEGRNIWLAFPSLINLGDVSKVLTTFKPACHIFYGWFATIMPQKKLLRQTRNMQENTV